jgi:hypothetical protein
MRFRISATSAVVAALTLVAPLPAWAASARASVVSVTGQVATPVTYTIAELAALPQTTYPVRGGSRTVTGANLEDVVERSAPVLPAGKNTSLRATITVSGRHHRSVTFALGELDPSFGDHPAVLTTTGGRVARLVVPADRDGVRSISDVTGVRVAVSAATAATVPAGAIEVVTGHRTVVLTAARLARLWSRTLPVSFLAGTAAQPHTESGPPLSLVLLAAGVAPRPGTPVVAVGSDDYAAAVTLAEDTVGGRPLLLSTVEDGVPLPQPRLVPDGDVKGGRYVSDVVVLRVGG